MVSSGCGSVASNLLSGSGAGVCVSAFATLTCLGSIRRDSVEVSEKIEFTRLFSIKFSQIEHLFQLE